MNRLAAALVTAVMFAAVVGCDESPLSDDRTWVLESLNGHAPVEGFHPTLRVNEKQYGGQDGCNTFSGRSWNGKPVATDDGTFSAPSATQTLRGCEGPAGVAEQADAYMDALMEGERFRVEGDLLEIIDGAGETRLVFVRQVALPGRAMELAGTAWLLIDEESGAEQATTLAFLNERIVAGTTACRGYVADYSVSKGRVGFPGLSIIRSTESCRGDARDIEGWYINDLFWAGDYSVDERSGQSLLRMRTRRGKTLVFEPLMPAAVDDMFEREWSLTTFVEPRKTSSYTRFSYTTEVVEGREVMISFQENFVSGSTGCNSYSAHLSVEGPTIEVGNVSVTRMACKDPEGLMEQERRYLEVLRDVKRFNTYGDRLAMRTDDDEVLIFQAE